MAEPRPRRARLKRIVLWTAATAVLVVGYVTSAPFVDLFFVRHDVPFAKEVLGAFYAPLVYISQNPDAPGHDAFEAYIEWCGENFQWVLNPDD